MNNVLKGTVILEEMMVDFNKIKENLKKDWQIEVNSQIEKKGFRFNIGNTLISVNENTDENIKSIVNETVKRNLFWIDGENEIKKGNSYIDIIVENGKDRVKIAKLFVKVVTSVLNLEKSIGILNNFTVIPKEDYIEVASEMKEDIFPTLNLIYFGFYRTENGIGAYTRGLNYFGKRELEILDTDVDVEKLYTFLIDVADYVITEDVKLNEGETLGFNNNQKIPLTISAGIAVDEDSIKIELNNKNIM